MITNLEPVLYSVDYNFELKKWLEESYFFSSESLLEYVDAVILGYSFTTHTFIETKTTNKYGNFYGNVFEIEESTKYNVEVNLKYNGAILETINTNDGEFRFNNLNPQIKYDLEFNDLTNKYSSKLLNKIQPDIDINQDPVIYIIDNCRALSEKFYITFGIIVLGEPQVNLARAPANFKIDKINDTTYSVSGPNINKDFDFDILLDDYRDGGTKSVIKNIKANPKLTNIFYKCNNTLSDTTGKYNLKVTGNPIISSDHISIDGKANSVAYTKTECNDYFRDNPFTIYVDFVLKGFKNTANNEKVIFSTSGAVTNARSIQICVVQNKYLKFYISQDVSGTAQYSTILPLTEIEIGKRNVLKIVNDPTITTTVIFNDKIIYTHLMGFWPAVELTGFGDFTFGYNSTDNTLDKETILDLYEFRIMNHKF